MDAYGDSAADDARILADDGHVGAAVRGRRVTIARGLMNVLLVRPLTAGPLMDDLRRAH
jgi:hypothetical protein